MVEINTDKLITFEPKTDREAYIADTLGEKYHFIKKLGKGNFATVYAVVNKSLDRVEALKVLSEDLMRDKDFLDRFQVEAKICASFAHPNIVTIYDYKNLGEFYFFSMFYIDGPSLVKFVKPPNILPINRICKNIATICDAIHYAHQRGVVHRDIKASNIMLDRSGKPYITDFGIAKSRESLTNTKAGTIMGSPHYISPEQVEGYELDHRADIYALGVTLYALLTQRYPFEGETAMAIIAKRLSQQPTPPEAYTPDLPHRLKRIISKTLQVDRGNRYQTAAELAEALNHFVASSKQATEARASTTPPIQPRPAKKNKSSVVMKWLIPATLVAVTPLYFTLKHYEVAENKDKYGKPQSESRTGALAPEAKIDFPAEISDLEIAGTSSSTSSDQKPYIEDKNTDIPDATPDAIENHDHQQRIPRATASFDEKPPKREIRTASDQHIRKKTNDSVKVKPFENKQTNTAAHQQLKKEMKTLSVDLKENWAKGDYEACLRIANIASSRLYQLPAPLRANLSVWQIEINGYKKKAYQKIKAQKKLDQDVNQLVAKIGKHFEEGDYAACDESITAARSKIDRLPTDQKNRYSEIIEKLNSYESKVDNIILTRKRQLAVVDRIKKRVAEGNLKKAISLTDAMLYQTDLFPDIAATLHSQRKIIVKIMKSKNRK